MKPAVVLLSGGMDSTTCLAIAQADHGYQDIYALSMYYGQKHITELRAAEKIAAYYNVKHHIIELPPFLFKSNESSLTGGREMPHQTYQEIAAAQGVSPTYVPFRNANLLSAATAFALVREAEALYFGAHAEDSRGWAYPDCTPEFIGAMANAIWVGSYHKVRLVTPLEWMMKKDIVIKGEDLGVPWGLTHSCYEGLNPPCGKCPTCVERAEAFSVVGIPDPLLQPAS